MNKFKGSVRAPEFSAGLEWLNTDAPVAMAGLRGRLVVLDFWTSCCINCMHVLPQLARLERIFGDRLAVIGVHSPKFAAERSAQNILEAVERYRITHPVVNDARMQIWQAYAVRAWPTLMFVDPEGLVVFRHEGEFATDKMEETLGNLLAEYEKAGLLTDEPLPFNCKERGDAGGTLFYPGKVEWFEGRLFVADSGHSRVVVADEEGNVQDVIGSGERGLKDGDFASAQFDDPQGMAMAGDTLFVADVGSHTLREVDLKRREVSTAAGTGEQALYRHKGGDGRRNPLSSPYDLTFSGRSIYIAMAGFHQLWRFDISSEEIVPWAGSGVESIKDGLRLEAHLAQPMGIWASRGNVFFADSETSSVRVAKEGKDGRVVTLIGTGLFDFGDRDGVGKSTLLQHPQGVAVAGDFLYIADTYNDKIRIMSMSSLRVQTVKFSDENGKGKEVVRHLTQPAGLSFGGGALWIADTNGHSVKRFNPPSGVLQTIELKGI